MSAAESWRCIGAWIPAFAAKAPLAWEKSAQGNATPMTPTCRTPSDTTAPLRSAPRIGLTCSGALRKSAREKTSLGSWEAPLTSTPRIRKKCSGALKNTSHLGQKDARDKSARGKRPSHWEKVLGGNDGLASASEDGCALKNEHDQHRRDAVNCAAKEVEEDNTGHDCFDLRKRVLQV